VLAGGWALRAARHTSTTSRWRTGATTGKPCSRLYGFLGGALDPARGQLWACLLRRAAQGVPKEAPRGLAGDDSTKKKAGPQRAGGARYRNGAGAARQEDRTLRGVNFVWGRMRGPLPRWPTPALRVPLGLSRSRKEAPARQLTIPSQARSALARARVDCVAAHLPERRLRVRGAGGSAPQEGLRTLPASGPVVSRLLVPGKLSDLPPR
jgi:hypothetical protein